MKSITHIASAFALAPAAYTLSSRLGLDPFWMTAGFLLGPKAPDWLEMARWFGPVRFSVIPHRTITHTWWVWVGVLWWCWRAGLPEMYGQLVAGFCVSCLVHILADAMTPMGVPVINPFGKKRRLPAGALRHEPVFFLFCAVLSAIVYAGNLSWIS